MEGNEEFRVRVCFQSGDDAVYIGARIEAGRIQSE